MPWGGSPGRGLSFAIRSFRSHPLTFWRAGLGSAHPAGEWSQPVQIPVSIPGGFGGMDLYITFRGANGKWSAPRNLGAVVNTAGDETWPNLSPDGKYLFFCRGGENGFDPYWVDATVLGPAGE